MVRMRNVTFTGLIVGLLAAFTILSPQPARAQQAGNDGDCDDFVPGSDGGADLLLQLGCIRNQTNNLTVIHQAEVISRVVGARLAMPAALCREDECTEENGFRVTATADAPAAVQTPWNLWADVKYTWIDPGHREFSPTKGDLFNGTAGIDYRFNDRMVLGLVSSFESSDLDTGGLFPGNTNAQGFGGGAYAGFTLADNLILNAMATGTWIDTDNSFTGVSANIDSSRVQLSSGLTKYWYIGQTRITPSVQISWSKEFQDSFVDSNAAFNPKQRIESAVATSGTTIGHTFALSNGQSIEPWLAGNLDWTIYSQIQTDGLGKTKLGEFLDARIQAGFNWNIMQNMQLSASGEVGGLIHRDQDTYAGELNLAIQF